MRCQVLVRLLVSAVTVGCHLASPGWAGRASAQEPGALRCVVEQFQLPVGFETTLRIEADLPTAISGYRLDLNYQPRRVQVVDANPAAEGLNLDLGSSTAMEHVVRNEVVENIDSVRLDVAPGGAPPGQELLASMKIRALNPGYVNFVFGEVAFRDEAGVESFPALEDCALEVVAADGVVSTTSEGVPAPTEAPAEAPADSYPAPTTDQEQAAAGDPAPAEAFAAVEVTSPPTATPPPVPTPTAEPTPTGEPTPTADPVAPYPEAAESGAGPFAPSLVRATPSIGVPQEPGTVTPTADAGEGMAPGAEPEDAGVPVGLLSATPTTPREAGDGLAAVTSAAREEPRGPFDETAVPIALLWLLGGGAALLGSIRVLYREAGER